MGIETTDEDTFVYKSGGGGSVWIGLSRSAAAPPTNPSSWVWQNGSRDPPYRNWSSTEPNGDGQCVRQDKLVDGKWVDNDCTNLQFRYACSMLAAESCDSNQALTNLIQKRTCIKHEAIN